MNTSPSADRQSSVLLQNQYQAFYEGAPTALVTLTSAGVILEGNRAAAELLCVEKSALNGANFRKFVHPDSLSQFDQHLGKSVAHHAKVIDEITIKNERSTRVVRLESCAVEDLVSGAVAVYIALIDINAQVLMRHELCALTQELEHRVHVRTLQYKNSRHELDAILNAAPDCIITINSDGIIDHANKVIESLLGYCMKDIVGCDIKSLIPDDEASENEKLYSKLMHNNIASDFTDSIDEVKVKDSNGFLIPFGLFISRIDHANKFTLVLHDLRDIKRLRLEVLQATEEECIRISHDLHDCLGQDLAGMSMITRSLANEIVEKKDPWKIRFLTFSRTLDNCIQQLRGIIFTLAPMEINDGELVDALHKLARGVEQGVGLTCKVHVIGSRLARSVERDIQILRIAQEAVHNAIKHAHASTIEIQIKCVDDSLELMVSDDGIGNISCMSNDTLGKGITIMRYRANTLGGGLVIEGNVPSGLTVICRVPKKSNIDREYSNEKNGIYC